MRWLWAALLVAALVLSGCTSEIGGTALPDPKVVSQPDSSVGLIGNRGALDPCSLLDPADLAQFGTAQRPPQESYDYCRLRLPMSGAQVAVRFGLLEKIRSVGDLQARQAREVEPVGALRVFEAPPMTDRCARYIVFRDNVTMAVSADTADSPDKTVPELCAVAEKSTTVIAGNVAAKKLTHHQYPSTSFGPLDACKAAVVSLGQIPGLAAAEVTDYPAHHQCKWGSSIVPSLQVRFVLNEPSTASNVSHETIVGKPTGVYTVDVGGRSLCVAELKGANRELAQIVVRLAPNNEQAACDAARIVASEVWGKLPATS